MRTGSTLGHLQVLFQMQCLNEYGQGRTLFVTGKQLSRKIEFVQRFATVCSEIKTLIVEAIVRSFELS